MEVLRRVSLGLVDSVDNLSIRCYIRPIKGRSEMSGPYFYI